MSIATTTPAQGRSAARSHRRKAAVNAFRSAAETIGPIDPGKSLFAITRGQFSMIDAVRHVLDQLGPSRISLWTWCIADYEADVFMQLAADARITEARLVIDRSDLQRQRRKSRGDEHLISLWRDQFGPTSVRYVRNHAKIATVDNGALRVLLRGSMNLNFNPRFEQFDLTEGCPGFDLVRDIEADLPVLGDDFTNAAVDAATGVSRAFERSALDMFSGIKVWGK